MRHIKVITISLLFLIYLTGCTSKESKLPEGNNSVDKIINQQINNANTEENKFNTQNHETASNDNASTKQNNQNINSPDNFQDIDSVNTTDDEFDYDLTKMNSDMVYATIFNIMVYPDEYIGKTFRIIGNYAPVYYEPTAKYYHYVTIKDATACCSQGLEFSWDDGNHVYPDDYPEENTLILVSGIFESYKDDDDDNTYCRLKNATMEIIEH